MPALQYAIAIPSSGGKTTLSNQFSLLVDIDDLYTLRPLPKLWHYMNVQILERSQRQQSIPQSTATNLRARVASYGGPGRVLLTHSVAAAKASGLCVLGALVPDEELHEWALKMSADRDETSSWFARRNREWLKEETKAFGVPEWTYDSFMDLQKRIEKVVPEWKPARWDRTENEVEDWKGRENEDFEQLEESEELLLQLCTTATGCLFEVT